MKIVIDEELNIPLFHGTSTIFLESIEQFGLGGRNPIKEWKIYELSQVILKLSDTHLKDSKVFKRLEFTYRKMATQSITAAGFNFQHGNGVYLSPSKKTAVSYASHNLFGSELISSTLELLRELVEKEVAGVRDDLFKKFPDAFRLLDINPAPILIQVNDVPATGLLDENGGDASVIFDRIEEYFKKFPSDVAEEIIQQENFRMTVPAKKESLQFWLINVIKQYGWSKPDYSLYRLEKFEN